MKRLLGNVSIFKKISAISLLGVFLGMLLLFFYVLPNVAEKLLEEKKQATRNAADLVYSLLLNYQKKVDRGELTLEEAQARAKQTVNIFRYNGDQYFWINDLTARVLVHPMMPSIVNEDMSNFMSESGTPIFKEFARIGKERGEGFIEYDWANSAEKIAYKKMSFVRYFEPWGWVIGTGIKWESIHFTIDSLQKIILTGAFFLGFVILVIGFSLAKLITDPIRVAVRALEKVAQGELDQVLPAGPKDETGVLLRSIQSMITELKQSRERENLNLTRAQEQERYISKILNSLHDTGVFLVEVNSGRIADVNESGSKILLYKRDELIGKGFGEVCRAALTGTAEFQSNSGEVVSRDGLVLPVLITKSAIGIKGKEYVLYCITNISERVKQEKTQEELRVKLIQTSRLASIGVLAAGVAHEVNNPLTIALGCLADLGECTLESERQLRVSKIQKSLERVSKIVKKMTVFSGGSNQELIELDVCEVVRNTADIIFPGYQPLAIETRTDLPKQPLKVKGIESHLQQIVLNLLSNAKDAVQEVKGKKQVAVRCEEIAGQVVLEVSDSGKGIRQEDLSKVCDPFFTTKDPGKGTGLGLTIVHQLVTQMKGDIQIQSSLEQGTRVSVSFPSASAH